MVNFSVLHQIELRAGARCNRYYENCRKGDVKLLIVDGILIKAYHTPMFSANISSAALLSDRYEVFFALSIMNNSACLIMRKRTFGIVAEYPLRGRLYPRNLPSITRKANTVYARSEKYYK